MIGGRAYMGHSFVGAIATEASANHRVRRPFMSLCGAPSQRTAKPPTPPRDR